MPRARPSGPDDATSSEESEQDLVEYGSKPKYGKIVAIAGLGLAAAAGVGYFACFGFGAKKLHPGWIPKHMETSCKGVVVPEARRLSELWQRIDAAEEEYNLRGPRRLEHGAVFDPSFLYDMHLFGKYKMPYYGSSDLDADVPNSAKEAILFLHGALRNAQDYFCALKATVEATIQADKGPVMHNLEDYIIISPKYHYYADIHDHDEYNVSSMGEATELFWNGSRPYGDWRGGAAADSHSDAFYNSFEVIDEMLLALGDPARFPQMRRVVIAGHSAGGQAVQRYALVTHLRPQSLATDATLKEMKSLRPGIDVRYIVANPSSFGYLNTMRWMYSFDAVKQQWTSMTYAQYDPAKGRMHWDDQSGRRRTPQSPRPWGVNSPNYEPFSAEKQFICRDSKFNDWTYGLNWTHPDFGDLVPYLQLHPHLHRAAEFYGARDVIYLVGQNDTCSDDMFGVGVCLDSCWDRNDPVNPCYKNSMDVRCPAMLQGPNRNARARGYMAHLEHHFGKPVHRLYEIPGVGHQAQAMFNSELGRKALFESLKTQLTVVDVPVKD